MIDSVAKRGKLMWAFGAANVAAAASFGAAPALAEPVSWKMHIVWVPAREEAKAYRQFADL